MKILQFTKFGDGLDFAIDAKRNGHEVIAWIKNPECRKKSWNGIVKKVEGDGPDPWKKSFSEVDYCFFDSNGLSDEWEIASKVKPSFGGSKDGERMEKDRAFARSLFEGAGMKTLESLSFKTLKEAEAHLKEHKIKHVVKITGGDSDSDDVLISELKDGADAIALMHRFEDQKKRYDAVEIEERVFGIEIGCAGYFNGKKWVGPIEINFQHKEFAAGRPGSTRGLGFLVGETGTLIKYVTTENAFFKKTLNLFTAHLKKINYRGEIDVGTITNEDGIFPLEFTPRSGYPDFFIRRPLAKSSQQDFFGAIARGEDFDFETFPGWALGFLVMAPGFPYHDAVKKHSAEYPIFGYDEKNINMHLQEATISELNKDKSLVVTDGTGYAACVSGRGATIESAARAAYWQVHPANEKRLYIPKAWVREDIGDRVLVEKEEILELGLMKEDEWDS